MRIKPPDRVAQHAINGLLKLGAAVHRVKGDSRYSPSGKKDLLLQDRTDSVKLSAALESELTAAEKSLAGANEQFFAVPEPAQNDVVGYFREMEIRNYLRTLSTADAMKYLEHRNVKPAVLHAVLRSPVPNAQLEEFATRLWCQQRELSDPVYAEGLILAGKSIDWSRAILRTTAGLARRALMEGVTPSELVAITQPLGVSETYGFNRAEAAGYLGRTAA